MARTIGRSYFTVFTILVTMTLVCVLATSGGAATGDTTRLSVTDSGNQANGGSQMPSTSGDGRFVAFISDATNLVPNDTNDLSDVFVRDRETGTTELVSVDSSGTQGNGESYSPSISADGRFVVFVSSATNLVSGDTNGQPDVFVSDRQTGTVDLVNLNSSGEQANGDTAWYSLAPAISADGHYVAFVSSATNLVEGDNNDSSDVFVRNLQEEKTELVSVNTSGEQANGDNVSFSQVLSISADGQYVAFDSEATNLVSDDYNASSDVFVRDRKTQTTELVSVNGFGYPANDYSYAPSISDDGRYVAFSSNASGLVSLSCGPNLVGDVFVRDRQTRTTEWVTRNSCADEPNESSYYPSISADGRYVVFHSWATNLVPGDTNFDMDVFVRDRQTKTIEWVSVDNCGTEANSDSWYSSISDDGRYVAFDSFASNLVPGDTNDSSDVFVRDRQPETTQPKECNAPTTTRTLSPQPNAAGWNNSNVGVILNATDTGGSGLKEIWYSINGGEPTTVQQDSVQIPITSEGSTTISYHSTDNAGNIEPQQTLTVKIDKSAPSVSTVAPTNTATGTSLTATAEATFSEAMDPNTFSTNAFTLTRQNASTPVAATVNYSSTTNKATLAPSSGLAPNTTYTATIKGGTDGVKDVAGNVLAQDYSWTFTTGPPQDTTAPKVSTATPTGTGVVRGTNATATFSERMDPTFIDASTFKLFKCSSTTSTNCATQITNVTITRSTDRLKTTLNPYGTSSTLLAGKTKFKVVVTTGAKDEAGNQLDQDPSVVGNQNKVWYFTTGRS